MRTQLHLTQQLFVKRLLAAALAVGFAFGAAENAVAADAADAAMEKLAVKVQQYLSAKSDDSVQLGKFTGPADIGTTVSKLLREKLTAKKLKLDSGPELNGECIAEVDGPNLLVRVSADMRDRSGAPVKSFSVVFSQPRPAQ